MNIVILSTFPATAPSHGGQHHIANLIRVLREAGHKVQSAGVLGGDHYESDEYFCPFPGPEPLNKFIESSFLMEDWALGKLFYEEDEYYNSLAELISPRPDVIWTEHPWLFPFAQRYVKENSLTETSILYWAANIEHRLKYDILTHYMTKKESEVRRDLILESELHALREADGVFCVSKSELEWAKEFTDKLCGVSETGVANRRTTKRGIVEANRITQGGKYALLVASGHPPNTHGFYEIFKDGIGCLAPNEKLVVAGGVGASIVSDPLYQKTACIEKTIRIAGVVSEECLQGLIAMAHTIVLPITYGSGTNLKTAEALWAGKHIVATSIAMRGFERFSNARGVTIADTSQDFLTALRQSMDSQPIELTPDEVLERRAVLWDETLRGVVDYIDEIAREKNLAPALVRIEERPRESVAARVWFNVTSSVAWSRPPVGIIRVERIICAGLEKLYGSVLLKKCIWQEDAFYEWDGDFSAPVEFRHGDIFITLGLDWDYQYPDDFQDLVAKQGVRILAFCYDLIPILYPQYCVEGVPKRVGRYLKTLAHSASAVFCISKQTRDDFIGYCKKISGEKIPETHVVQLGDNVPGERGRVGHEVDKLLNERFILFVSTIERRKNHEVLYRAYHQLVANGHGKVLPQLVFVGMPGWGVGGVLKDIELDPLTQGKITMLNHVGDHELQLLYKNCLFCVYPSLYEGWGLPLGEALSMGKTVLSSNRGSLPEVGGDLVTYLDPWDVQAWANTILEWSTDSSRIHAQEERVSNEYVARKWDDAVLVVKNVIDSYICE